MIILGTKKQQQQIRNLVMEGKIEEANELISQIQEQEQESEKEQPQPQEKQQKQPEQQPKEQKEEPKKETKMQSFIKPKEYETIKIYIENNEPVMLYGEAGAGKNYIVQKICEELNLNFYFANAVLDPVVLQGYGNAKGDYVKTQFYDFCINGGVFMFDEIDASNPEVLKIFNGAIANRYFDFPVIGRVKLHSNCRFVACANTSGDGSDIKYVGANQIDASTIDRFAQIKVEYDKKVELQLANNDIDLVNFIEDFRNAINKIGIQSTVVSYRSISRIAKLLGKINDKDLLKQCLTKSLNSEDLNMIHSNMKLNENRFYSAFKKLF